MALQSMQLDPGAPADVIAPDGSEIRLLPAVKGTAMSHCTLPPGAVTTAVTHRTVEEIWYFLSGAGEVWRKRGGQAETLAVSAGSSLDIPLGVVFQFRNTGREPLRFLIATTPPWPGPEEAVPCAGPWIPTQ